MKTDDIAMNFQDKVAVITGGASGIGLGLVHCAVSYGMQVAIADIEAEPLFALQQALEAKGVAVIARVVNVTQEEQVTDFAKQCIEHFGRVDYLFNNAGVAGLIGPIWEIPTDKLQWMIDVNLMGVAYCVKAFMPYLLQQDSGHIINTASMAGMYSAPYLSCYEISKHAVVALTEALYHDLQVRKSQIKVSLLCPGWVKTKILNAERNCPLPPHEVPYENYTEQDAKWVSNFAKSVKRGITGDEVAKIVFDGIVNNKFYIFTHPTMKQNIKNRMQAIMDEDDPAQLVFEV